MTYDQTDLSTWQVQLHELGDLGGYTQTQNVPPTQIQRPVLSQLGAGTDYWTKLELYSVLHGYLNNNPAKPASLIIFEAKFIYRGSNPEYRFRSARIKVGFSDYGQLPVKTLAIAAASGRNLHQRTRPGEPEVTCFAPFRIPENRPGHITDVEEERHLGGEVGGDAQGIASAKVAADKNKKESYQVQYFSRGSADTEYNESTGRCDSVWWDLQENPDPKIRHRLGIEANALLAVLVERQSDAPFLGHFDFQAVAQTWLRRQREQSDTTNGIAPRSSPINFDPAYPPQGKLGGIGIDTNHLERFQDFSEIARLVKVLQPLGPPVKFLDAPPEPLADGMQQ